MTRNCRSWRSGSWRGCKSTDEEGERIAVRMCGLREAGLMAEYPKDAAKDPVRVHIYEKGKNDQMDNQMIKW